jgi:hypothetical protein
MSEAGAFDVMDRATSIFRGSSIFTLGSAFFFGRTKSNLLLQRRYSHPADKGTGARPGPFNRTVVINLVFA